MIEKYSSHAFSPWGWWLVAESISTQHSRKAVPSGLLHLHFNFQPQGAWWATDWLSNITSFSITWFIWPAAYSIVFNCWDLCRSLREHKKNLHFTSYYICIAWLTTPHTVGSETSAQINFLLETGPGSFISMSQSNKALVLKFLVWLLIFRLIFWSSNLIGEMEIAVQYNPPKKPSAPCLPAQWCLGKDHRLSEEPSLLTLWKAWFNHKP